MVKIYSKELHPVTFKLAGHELSERRSYLQFVYTDLDCDFPQAGNAYEKLVGTLLNARLCLFTKPWVILYKPEKGVRVEQQPHSMYSLNSSDAHLRSQLLPDFVDLAYMLLQMSCHPLDPFSYRDFGLFFRRESKDHITVPVWR